MESPIQWETAYTSCCVTQGFISQRFVSLAVTVIHNSYNTSYRCNCCSVLKRYELKNENKKTFKKLEISLIKKNPIYPIVFPAITAEESPLCGYYTIICSKITLCLQLKFQGSHRVWGNAFTLPLLSRSMHSDWNFDSKQFDGSRSEAVALGRLCG